MRSPYGNEAEKAQKKNAKKRLAITEAGRKRIATKRYGKGGQGSTAGFDETDLAWKAMADAARENRRGMTNAERMADAAKGIRDANVLKAAEAKNAYNAEITGRRVSKARKRIGRGATYNGRK